VRLARYDGRLAVLGTDGGAFLTDLTHGRFGEDVLAAIEHWDDLEQLVGTSPPADFEVDPALLGAPIPMPRQIFGIGMNYHDHAVEVGLPELPATPAVFTKFATSITGPAATVALPSAMVDFEVELLVVVKNMVENAAETRAWSHVAGLMVGQDLSERVLQLAAIPPQFSLGKSFKGFSPMGPSIVSPAEVGDPDALDLGCRIGDEILQAGNSKDLIFSVPELIARLSAVCTLLPGDVIWTGTPAGVGNARTPKRMLRPGEVLTSHVAEVGEISTTFIAGPTHPETE
jgi:2,4-diketo-3-deoxy-L-fuconate hydrolase